MRSFLVIAYLCFTTALSVAAVDRVACTRLLDPNLSDSGQKPPMITLTKEQIEKGKNERACLKSYSDGFPGGEEAFLHATSETLKADLKHVEDLFGEKPSLQSLLAEKDSDPDRDRQLHIALGWDRDQVLLWGNFYYVRRLYEEGRFDQIVRHAATIRHSFGLEVHPVPHWDKLEENTYFSKQSLRNMIAIIEYRARARRIGDDPGSQAKLAESFIAEREALKPFFTFAGDPTKAILTPYCKQ